MIAIAIVGPQASGKTLLAEFIASFFGPYNELYEMALENSYYYGSLQHAKTLIIDSPEFFKAEKQARVFDLIGSRKVRCCIQGKPDEIIPTPNIILTTQDDHFVSRVKEVCPGLIIIKLNNHDNAMIKTLLKIKQGRISHVG